MARTHGPVRGLPRTVLVFGLVSLLNDAASERIAPLLVFLASALPGALVILVFAFGLGGRSYPARVAAMPAWSWRGLDRRLRALLAGAGGLAIATVPEAFLVLWAAARGVSTPSLPLSPPVTRATKGRGRGSQPRLPSPPSAGPR